MKIYLTEYQNGNKIYAGINIFAVDDSEAEALAREQGVTIVGEITEVKFKEEFEDYLSQVEVAQRVPHVLH
jgi:hypothetical protein